MISERKELAEEKQKKARYVGNVRESSSESEQGSSAEEPNATTEGMGDPDTFVPHSLLWPLQPSASLAGAAW